MDLDAICKESDFEPSTKPIISGRPNEPVSQSNPVHSSENDIIERSILQAAQKYNLPPALIKAVIKAESNFDPGAVSSAGAQGLMQLMPATAEELGVKNSFDIEQNIDGGSHYLRKMLDKFGGNTKLALAAYNAGPGTVEKYHGNVPYPETRNYVKRVMRFSAKFA
ncbi:MAG: lytic transglycosylase domain-containing protein [Deltaproteobacteria bacterium]|nr:lytic transglycosylase domain-containing protein [Deltaproteobacteria bacterium]